MSSLLLSLLISGRDLLCSLSTVNNGKCLKLSILSLLIFLFIIFIGNVYLLKRNRRCLIFINGVCLYVNTLGSNHSHTGLIVGKEKHNLPGSFRIGKRSGALCICRLSGSSCGSCLNGRFIFSLCGSSYGSCLNGRFIFSLCGSSYGSCLNGRFIFSLCGSSCGSCLNGCFIFSLCGNSYGCLCLGRRCVFCLRSISLCSLDHDCGSLSILITLSRLECLKSLFFCRCICKKGCSLLDTRINRLNIYRSRCTVCSRGTGIVACGSIFHLNGLGCSVGRLILSSLSPTSLSLVISKKRVSLCDAGIYPRIFFYGSGRTLIRRIIFGHRLRLSKICKLLLCTDDSILFIVSGNVRHSSSIKACAEGDACTTHLCELIKLIHFAGLLLTRFCIGKGRRIALLVLLILLVFLALRRRSIGCIYRNGSSSRRNSKGHSDRI